MKAVILCGGKGIRIRDLSEDLPKPMIPIGPYPIVVHIMHIFARHGVREFVLCLGYKAWRFKELFLNYRFETSDITVDLAGQGVVEVHDSGSAPPWRVTLAHTGENAMTGARIKRVQKYVGEETFFLTYGDGVGDVDVSKLLQFHRAHGRAATVTGVRPPSRFGEMVVEASRVVAFEEKPQTSAGLINGGFFVCEPRVFDHVADRDDCTWEKEPMQELARGGDLMAYEHTGFWMPMDTTREFQQLNRLWDAGDPPWAPGGGREGR